MSYISDFYRHEEPLRRLIGELLPNSSRRALDLGCKTGDISYEIARKVDRLIAMDYVRHKTWRPGAILFVQADAHAIPLADASVDLVVSSEMLQYVRDWRGCLEEIHRVLSPGGRLILSFPEGGIASVYLDPFRLTHLVRRHVFRSPKSEGVVRWLKSAEVLEFCQHQWRIRQTFKNGSILYIYAAWLIDYLFTLETLIARSAMPARRPLAHCARFAVKGCMRIMKLDFAFSWRAWSYNNVLVLEKR